MLKKEAKPFAVGTDPRALPFACMYFKVIAIGLAISVAAALWLVRSGAIEIPSRWNPWATLEIDATPNWLTRYKLQRLSQDPAHCQAVLATSGMRFERLEDETTGTACGFFNAVRILRTSAAVGPEFALSCRTAVSLALWERHVLQPAAVRHYESAVAKIEHFGSYSCRNVYGRPNATRSRHATAEAFDVAGFVLANGERIRVINDWSSEHAAFLHEVRDGACRFFDGVLSPDYNAAHRDHFHLDRGSYRTCR
jgi:hypothetical protein